MKRFIILLRHQIWLMAISSSTYFAAFLFLGFMAAAFLWTIHSVSIVPEKESPTALFLNIFWLPVLFMVPLLTMRSISDELRRGTLASLMSTAVSAWQIVLSKFLACYIFYVMLWLLTLVYVAVACGYLPHVGADDFFEPSQLASGYSFVFLTGATYISIGIFASSLTRTTLVAGMLSFGMLFFFVVGAGVLESLNLSGGGFSGYLVRASGNLHTFRQLENFNNSLIDTRPFFFYLSTACVFLAVTCLITESKNR